MAKTKKSEQEKLQEQIDKTAKLFDVAEPNKTPAPATSKPVIVGHSSTIKDDPMVTPKKDVVKKRKTVAPEVKSEPVEAKVLVSKPKVIQPIHVAEPEEPKTPEPAPEEPALPEPVAEKSAPVVDAIVSQLDAKQTDRNQKIDTEKRVVEAQSLIASQKYFVPIGLVSKRRTHYRIIAILVLTILTTLAILNFGIDADVIDIGIEPLTNIL